MITNWLDDFFIRALLTGVGIALMAAPMGCVVIWRRMSYFGDTLAHSALLGSVIAYSLSIPPVAGVFLTASTVAVALFIAQRQAYLSNDALLGILSHSALAISLIAIALMPNFRGNLLGFLFGDILTVSAQDVGLVWLALVVAIVALWRIWDQLMVATISRELAATEGSHPERTELAFMLLIAAVIAVSMKLVGVLLITALLIIPAAAARRFARSPEQMAYYAAAIGSVSAIGGLTLSLYLDTPSGPSIVAVALVCFLASLAKPIEA